MYLMLRLQDQVVGFYLTREMFEANGTESIINEQGKAGIHVLDSAGVEQIVDESEFPEEPWGLLVLC